MSEPQKYPRSLHARISLGSTSDDRFHEVGYLEKFALEMPGHVLSSKLDGQNSSFTKRGVYARSWAAPSELPWDAPIIKRWESLKNDLGDIEIMGESVFASHSILYSKIESFYYVFAVRENGRYMSWEEVCFYANFFDLPTVPTYKIITPLKEFWLQNHKTMNEDKLLAEWLKEILGMSWEEYCETQGGELGGYDPLTNKPASEGFVLRNSDGFETNAGLLSVYPNEFDSLAKIVRKSHVKTDEHWTKNWKPASLINYDTYKWNGFEHYNIKK